MREHKANVKAQSMKITSTGVSFIVHCENYEESFHFQQVGRYSSEELKAKIDQSISQTAANHEHKLAGEDHLEALLKQYADGIPSCKECG